MIKNIKTKANDEKYFKSIRYFYHSLNSELRRKFIIELSEYNIYLAAQCIMSSQKDEEIEKKLVDKAESYAENYENFNQSAKGFLALAEFESFAKISHLLLGVEKPSKIHLNVFSKILEKNQPEIFISFIDVLIELKNITFISYCVNSYNGNIIITSDNREVFKNLINLLFENGNYGMTRVIFEKYDIFNEIPFILDQEPIKIVNDLLNKSKRQLHATKLAYEIYLRFNLVRFYKPEFFIEKILTFSGEKNISAALKIANTHSIDNEILNESIENLFNPYRKNLKLLNRVVGRINHLVSSGLFKYLDKNEFLLGKLVFFEQVTEKKINRPSIYSVSDFGFDESQYTIYDVNTAIPVNLPIDHIIDDYFNMQSKPNIEVLVNMLILHFKSSLKEISHLLRKYQFVGKVKAVFDYGFYIESIHVNSKGLLFLHKAQINEDEIDKATNEPDYEVKFRIIGINPKSYRFNVSTLEEFNLVK